MVHQVSCKLYFYKLHKSITHVSLSCCYRMSTYKLLVLLIFAIKSLAVALSPLLPPFLKWMINKYIYLSLTSQDGAMLFMNTNNSCLNMYFITPERLYSSFGASKIVQLKKYKQNILFFFLYSVKLTAPHYFAIF